MTPESSSRKLSGISRTIVELRGQRVILDRDLAALYGVSTKRLNEAVKRNAADFPRISCFGSRRVEVDDSQPVADCDQFLQASRIRDSPPFAFTEHGAIQAANVLNSSRAIEMGVHVVRAFVRLRELLASNKALAQKLDELERKYQHHDKAIAAMLAAIRELMNPSPIKRRGIGFTAKVD